MPDNRRTSDNQIKELLLHVKSNQRTSNAIIKAVNENKTSIKKLSDETLEMRDAYTAVKGSVKVSVFLWSIVKWMSGIGAFFYALYELIRMKL